jgi:flagellar hook-length control protein FliK
MPEGNAALQEMIESIHATIDLAARQGVSRARIALQPAELGAIRVHLSQSSDGLIARLTADTPAAAQALLSARAELHHSLSTLGTTLLRLEIGSSDQPGERQRQAGDAPATASGRSNTTGGEQSTDAEDQRANATVAPAGATLGELVDVLA